VLDVMIDLAESDMMMNCVTHEMWFARTVAYRLVFMHEKLIVESAPPEKFNSNPESKTTKWFFN
jgi:ABC-type polar amino acid transport system ATPase subunit